MLGVESAPQSHTVWPRSHTVWFQNSVASNRHCFGFTKLHSAASEAMQGGLEATMRGFAKSRGADSTPGMLPPTLLSSRSVLKIINIIGSKYPPKID